MADRKKTPTKLLTAAQILELERMAKIGMILNHCALVFDMGPRTLDRRLEDQPGVREAWDRGKAKAAVTVLGQLWGLIEDGNPAAIFFYCKTQLGWRETNNLEVRGTISIEQAIKEAFGGSVPPVLRVGPGQPYPDDVDADG